MLSLKSVILVNMSGTNSLNRFRIQRASWQTAVDAISSDSIVESATDCWLLLLQQIGDLPKNVKHPDVDFLSDFVPPQSASAKALISDMSVPSNRLYF
jgi:hypothetical protein